MNISRLKDLREDKDLRQIDIANLLKTTQQHYSQYEAGIRAIPIERLDMLANFYETSIDYLVGRTNEKKAYPRR